MSMILFVKQKHFSPFFNKCISELTTTAKFYRTPGTYIFAILITISILKNLEFLTCLNSFQFQKASFKSPNEI